jgi:hypothetical protein
MTISSVGTHLEVQDAKQILVTPATKQPREDEGQAKQTSSKPRNKRQRPQQIIYRDKKSSKDKEKRARKSQTEPSADSDLKASCRKKNLKKKKRQVRSPSTTSESSLDSTTSESSSESSSDSDDRTSEE